MKIALPHFLRRIAARALMRVAGFVFRRVVAPSLRPAPATARSGRGNRGRAQAASGRVLDGEFHRVDSRRGYPRHNDRW